MGGGAKPKLGNPNDKESRLSNPDGRGAVGGEGGVAGMARSGKMDRGFPCPKPIEKGAEYPA